MKVAQFRPYDIANGEGVRCSLFVSGCRHHCPGCFNGEYQDFDYGQEWDENWEEIVYGQLRRPEIQGLTLLGGEPMEHAAALSSILRRLQARLREEGIEKDFWVYSGDTYEQILKSKEKKSLLDCCDVLVDGLFVEALQDPSLAFRGSSNQRLIHLREKKRFVQGV